MNWKETKASWHRHYDVGRLLGSMEAEPEPSLCSHCGAEEIYAAGLCADCHEAWSEQFSD